MQDRWQQFEDLFILFISLDLVNSKRTNDALPSNMKQELWTLDPFFHRNT
jgi:hypothetical protein